MGRVNRYKPTHRKDPRWVEFGKWLEQQRGETRLKQEQAAAAIGISTRQWIRYTQGAPVPEKRIAKMIKVLGLPPKKAYLRAGYEMPRDLAVWADSYLLRIRDAVFKGTMWEALMFLYDFYYESMEEKKRYRPVDTSLTCQDFITAALATDRMPAWLREEFLLYLWAVRKGGKKSVFDEPTARKREVREKIKRDLPKLMLQQGRITPDEFEEAKSPSPPSKKG